MSTATQPLPSPPIRERESVDIFRRAILLNLSIGLIGESKKMNPEEIQAEADKDRLKVSKTLMASDEFTALKNKRSQIRTYIYSRSLPSLFKAGVYLIPNTLIQEVDARLSLFAEEMKALAEAFITAMPRIKETDKAALKGNYHDDEYPSPSEVRRRIGVTWNYFRFGVPDNLPDNVFSREQEKSRARLEEATASIEAVLRAEMAKTVKQMIEKLAGDEDGKPKQFKADSVERIKGFFDVLKERNITNDEELDALCEQARSLLNGVDPNDLRDNQNLRQTVSAGFGQIQTKLDDMIVTAAARKIQLNEEDGF